MTGAVDIHTLIDFTEEEQQQHSVAILAQAILAQEQLWIEFHLAAVYTADRKSKFWFFRVQWQTL